jgi:hypothetical protein
MILLAILSWF